jgi:hypothetical protein
LEEGGMIRALLADIRLGRQVMKAAAGIVDNERIVGHAPWAILPLSTELQGDFEIIVRRKGGDDGRS